MRSYIKIYGPPVYDALKALEELAIPIEEVCIMDTIFESGGIDIPQEAFGSQEQELAPAAGFVNAVEDYFTQNFGQMERKRCENIISLSGQSVGEYDFYFEWFGDPDISQIEDLIKKIDEALKPLGCRYSITTKEE